MDNVLPKRELLRQLRLFKDDEKRGISMKHFADAAGVNHEHMLRIIRGEIDLTEYMQRRLHKTLREFKEGKIVVMQNRNRTHTVEYRRVAKPVAKRHYGISFENGEFKLKLGLRQKGDYSAPTLSEQMNRGQK